MDRQYVIMAGGTYEGFDKPRALLVIRGETILGRTIRMLHAAGISDGSILITGTDSRLEGYGIDVLRHKNDFATSKDSITGYWLDAFYPYFDDGTKITFLYGDVVYTQDAINTIVHNERTGNILFGTSMAKNEEHENWGEPFAYKVDDYRTFMDGVAAVKKLYDEGKLERHPITWELYRYLNGLDVNVQTVKDETYICIDDGTDDIDYPHEVERYKDGREKEV